MITVSILIAFNDVLNLNITIALNKINDDNLNSRVLMDYQSKKNTKE